MNVKQAYNKIADWYFGLTWWKKILACVVLVILFVLGVIYIAYRFISGQGISLPLENTTTDNAHDDTVKVAVGDRTAVQKKLETELMIKKTLVMGLVKERKKQTEQTEALKQRIVNATSFTEIDDILQILKK
jgi:hypothetical protein